MPSYTDVVAIVEAILGWRSAYNHHGPRTNIMGMEFANKLYLSPHEIEMIGVSGSLHDIGKIFVPDQILNVPRTLSATEYAHVKPHAREGWKLLQPLGYDPIILDVVLHHHEKWDGSGYPDALRGEQISIYSRIMTIVDVYDSLTHIRPHRAAFSHEEAMAEMYSLSGTWFDPDLLTVFFEKVVRHG